MKDDLPSALRRRMAELGISQSEAARRMGVGRDRVSLWLRGRTPDVRHGEALAAFLGIEEDELAVLIYWTQWKLAQRDPWPVPEAGGTP